MGREKVDKSTIDPFVEVSLHIPDWTQPRSNDPQPLGSIPFTQSSNATLISARTLTYRTGIVKNNGFNPVWQHTIRFQFDCVGGMKDLIFLRFAVKAEDKEDEEPLASYCASLGNSHEGQIHPLFNLAVDIQRPPQVTGTSRYMMCNYLNIYSLRSLFIFLCTIYPKNPIIP